MKSGMIVLLLFLSSIDAHSSLGGDKGKLIEYKQPLTFDARHCLAEVLKTGSWRHSPQFHKEMMSIAGFAQINLSGITREQYVYVMKDFGYCGTAGCSMLIGEEGKDGICHEIYSGSGFEGAITVLSKSDRGYRRLLVPCELRFDGHEYQQIHEECPNADVQR